MKKKYKKIGIIGHFATKVDKNDGQTVKTREIYNTLVKNKCFNISTVDTQDYRKTLFSFLISIFRLIKNNDDVIIIVASGGMKVLIPIFVILNLIFRKKICYCVVGSWLDTRIKNNKFLKYCLKKVNKIFVETSNLKENLSKLGLKNVEIMYNFKNFDNKKINIKKEKNTFCIFSRIMREKGIEDAIYAINRLNDEGIKCSLGIYGPVENKYKDEFEKIVSQSKKNVRYYGCVNSEESKKYISKYWMLLFPTHYIKEGLPGTLLDAYNASTPVIASNWISASEFVPNNVGYI